MKNLKQHILEKLKVSKNNRSNITLESLVDALKDFKDRNRIYAVYIDLKDIFEKYPTVLQYHGTYTDKYIIGNEILGLRYNKDEVFIHFNQFVGDSVKIANTKDLYDIFGEEVLSKIYDYIVKH